MILADLRNGDSVFIDANIFIYHLGGRSLECKSLRAKKYDEARDIWQARVNGGWRFYFQIEGDTYYLLNITPHP